MNEQLTNFHRKDGTWSTLIIINAHGYIQGKENKDLPPPTWEDGIVEKEEESLGGLVYLLLQFVHSYVCTLQCTHCTMVMDVHTAVQQLC